MRELKIARAKAGMTLVELEAASGVTASNISKIERGVTQPQAATLRKLADALGVDIAEFIEPELAGKGSASSASGHPYLQEWLEEHGATRLLLPDEDILRNFERLASGSDRQAVVDRFEQEAREAIQEEARVLDELQLEWAHGGKLIPKDREPGARMREKSRLGQEMRFRYRRYLATLDRFGEALFLEGRADDFVMVVSRPQIAEARKAALRQLREQAFEGERGA